MGPTTRRMLRRRGWILDLAVSVFFLVFAVSASIELIPVNLVAAIGVLVFGCVASCMTFALALRTRRRARVDAPDRT